MRLRIDDEELSLSPDILEAGKKSIYDAASQMALARGRVIMQITVDGEKIDTPEAFAEISGGLDIRFETQDKESLVRETVEEGSAYLPKLIAGLGAVASKFERGETAEAKGMMADAAEGIHWLFGVFAHLCAQRGVQTSNLKRGSFESDADEIKNVLTEMNTILENGQEMRLAFVIRDKLLPVIERFSGYWDEVARTIDAPIQ